MRLNPLYYKHLDPSLSLDLLVYAATCSVDEISRDHNASHNPAESNDKLQCYQRSYQQTIETSSLNTLYGNTKASNFD